MREGTGLKKETAAALSYILGPLSGFVFLLLEKDSFVRFHAMQSILALGFLMAVGLILGFLPFFSLIWILFFVLVLFGAYHASQGREWEMPIVGKLARKLLKG